MLFLHVEASPIQANIALAAAVPMRHLDFFLRGLFLWVPLTATSGYRQHKHYLAGAAAASVHHFEASVELVPSHQMAYFSWHR